MTTIDPVHGNIQVTPPHCLMKKISDDRLKGCLDIVFSDSFKHIYFDDGFITTVDSSNTDEHLLQMLLMGSVLTEDQIPGITSVLKFKGWNAPEILNVIDASKQNWWLRTQIREVILALFEWRAGTYRLNSEKTPPKTLPVCRMDTVKLLETLIGRLRDSDTLVNMMGGAKQVLTVDMANTRNVLLKSLTAQDGFYLSRIDGVLTVREILMMAGNQKIEMARSLVKFHLHGLIREKHPRKADSGSETVKSTTLEDIRSEKPARVTSEAPETDAQENGEGSDTSLMTDEISLTDEELKDLQMLARTSLDGDFFDLAKALHLGPDKKIADVGYDESISYLRGDKFINGESGGYDVDGLTRISSVDEMTAADDDRIAYIIDGKVVDGESDLFGTGLSKEIFTEADEDKQWNMWLMAEEELTRDFEKDWTSTWSDWVENTAGLNAMQREIEKTEVQLKETREPDLKESILNDLRRKSAEFQDVIRRKKREMYSIHRRMQLMSFYDLLRVEQDADTEKIKKAFEEWETHLLPSEEFVREFSSMAPQIAEIVNLITSAYHTLSNEEKRAQYDIILREKKKAVEDMKVKKRLLAEDHMLSARTATRRGDAMLALRFIRGCISLDPANSLYYREMANLLAQNTKWRKEALLFYHRAYHLSPDDLHVLLEVADLASQLNLTGFAIRALNQVLAKEPENVQAKRLKRKIELTR